MTESEFHRALEGAASAIGESLSTERAQALWEQWGALPARQWEAACRLARTGKNWPTVDGWIRLVERAQERVAAERVGPRVSACDCGGRLGDVRQPGVPAGVAFAIRPSGPPKTVHEQAKHMATHEHEYGIAMFTECESCGTIYARSSTDVGGLQRVSPEFLELAKGRHREATA